jgi:hypothetical protein
VCAGAHGAAGADDKTALRDAGATAAASFVAAFLTEIHLCNVGSCQHIEAPSSVAGSRGPAATHDVVATPYAVSERQLRTRMMVRLQGVRVLTERLRCRWLRGVADRQEAATAMRAAAEERVRAELGHARGAAPIHLLRVPGPFKQWCTGTQAINSHRRGADAAAAADGDGTQAGDTSALSSALSEERTRRHARFQAVIARKAYHPRQRVAWMGAQVRWHAYIHTSYIHT